jgi:two-component sensor histidine kinase
MDKEKKSSYQHLLQSLAPLIEELLDDKTALKRALLKIQQENTQIPYILIEKQGKYFIHSDYYTNVGLSEIPITISQTLQDDSTYTISMSFYINNHKHQKPIIYLFCIIFLAIIFMLLFTKNRFALLEDAKKKLQEKTSFFRNENEIENIIIQIHALIDKNDTLENKIKILESEFESQLEIKTASLINEIKNRKSAEISLEKSVAEKVVLLKEIHHRVKNNMAIITGLIRMQARQIKDTQIKDIFIDLQNRIKTMELIHTNLYSSENFSSINFEAYLNSLVRSVSLSYTQKKKITISIDCKDIILSIEEAIACGQIINELITNAYKHAFKHENHGLICVKMTKENDVYTLTVNDNGDGLKESRIESMSIGMQLVNDLIKYQLKGSLEVYNNEGLTYIIIFKEKITL